MVRTLCIVSLLLLATMPARAQENAALPDLAPREVEITGDLSISFPSLRRQPLIGFNPPPRVPEIPESRRPFTEAYKQASASLPPSPLAAPAPPDVSAFAARTPVGGQITVLAGTFLDRSLDLDMSFRPSPSQEGTVSVTYFGTNGASNASTGDASARDAFHARAGWAARTGPGRLRVAADLTRNAWSLFGAVPAAGTPALPDPDRSLTGYGASMSWATDTGVRLPVRLALGWEHANVNSDLYDPAVRTDPATERDESRLTADLDVRFPVGEHALHVTGRGSLSGLDREGAFTFGSLRSGQLDALWSTPSDRVLTISAGAAILGYEASIDRNHLAYLSPVIDITYWMSSAWRVFGGTNTELVSPSLIDLFTESPYLVDEPNQWSSLSPWNLHAGIAYRGAVSEGSLRAGWKEYATLGYLRTETAPIRGYTSGLFSRNSDEARSLYVEGDISLVLSTSFQAGSSFRIQDVTLTGLDVRAPFMSPVSAAAWLGMTALDARLHTRLDGMLETSRRVSVTSTDTASSLVSVGVTSSYVVAGSAAVVLRFRHLLSAPEFWPGYPLEGTSVNAGLRWQW